jgi:hypothetical protein
MFTLEQYNSISICFNVGHEKPMQIGKIINKNDEEEGMNGYDWQEYIFNKVTDKDIFIGMETDTESGEVIIRYELNDENKARASKLVTLIEDIIENY